MSVVAIQADGLGKQYRIGRSRGGPTAREVLVEAARAPLRRMTRWAGGESRNDPRIWALRDISFEVRAGEAVGIIGGNGAGKSTLLKILSRITNPTEGWAEIRGRVGSLMEVGTGFHSELTGRENVYMNGAILGMRKAEIKRKFDEIVAFAEVEKFLDTPVKHYSSGMQVRLAFAVAAHLQPEILIVDEVLAVGDAEFQRKCLGKMRDVSRSGGRTVLFVSHNMNAIQRLCSRCILLEGGRLRLAGSTEEVIAHYLTHATKTPSPEASIDLSHLPRTGTGAGRFIEARLTSLNLAAASLPYPDGPLEVEVVVAATEPQTIGSLAVTVYDQYSTKLVNADTIALGRSLRLRPGRNRFRLRIEQLHLNPGVYMVGLWLADPVGTVLDLVESAFPLEVVTLESRQLGASPDQDGVVTCPLTLLDWPD
jgi:lipopolysaccharide transport system ATP-binding protein